MQSRNTCLLLNTRGSLLCTSEPATAPYPNPDKSGPHSHPVSLRSVLIVFSHQSRSLKWPVPFRFSDCHFVVKLQLAANNVMPT
jgi:hypothetical protein